MLRNANGRIGPAFGRAVRASGIFWASWADALPMIAKRNPEVASEVVQKLSQEEPLEGCLLELHTASSTLDRQGFC